jgi:alpha-beta hydrolase superfamily lysophospholipase
MAGFFSDRGYAVLTIDYRGFGESEGSHWHLDPKEQVADVRNALTYLAQREEVEETRLGLYGTSLVLQP